METLTERTVGSTLVAAVQADITTLEVDAIVNAANESLAHGGGVAAAIAQAGAPEVQRESNEWVAEHGMLRTGRAAVTSAGAMSAKHVVHVVGPRFAADQDNEGMLSAAVAAALEAAAAYGADSIALPAISAGVFGYPPDEATRVIVRAVTEWGLRHVAPSTVLLVGHDAGIAGRFASAINDLA